MTMTGGEVPGNRAALHRTQQELLRQFAWSNALLVLDFDGTLAPIVDDPERARMRPRTRALLERVCRSYPSVLLTGRSREDALLRIEGAPVISVLGNHGIESEFDVSECQDHARVWRPQLERIARGLPGVFVEDKGHSLAVHYRRSRQKRFARERILEAVEGLAGARILEGQLCINVLPEGAPHRGMAIRTVRAKCGCDTAIYVGDDTSESDVFSVDEPGRLLGIRVGYDPSSRARFFLRDQTEIDSLLERLVTLREAGRGGKR